MFMDMNGRRPQKMNEDLCEQTDVEQVRTLCKCENMEMSEMGVRYR